LLWFYLLSTPLILPLNITASRPITFYCHSGPAKRVLGRVCLAERLGLPVARPYSSPIVGPATLLSLLVADGSPALLTNVLCLTNSQ
jgi:hypothetical protein